MPTAWFILCVYKVQSYILKLPYFILPVAMDSECLDETAGFSTSNGVRTTGLI